MRRLLYRNYLSMIEALPNNELFRHIYVKNESGEEIDVTNNGQLSCAIVVSSVLCLIGWIDRPHATVNSTLHKLFENYVDKRSDVIRLAVTDKSCDYLDTKVMVAYSRTAARKDSGEPSEDDVKLEKIWDKA